MQKAVNERRLYIALDESNHGRYPEFVVAVSSLLRTDASPALTTGRERMTDEEIVKFLENEQRRYHCTKIEKGQISRNMNQLVESAPDLVERLVRENEKLFGRMDSVEILLDGDVRNQEIERLHNILCSSKVRRSMGVCVENYPKRESGSYDYSILLVAADSLAHAFFREHYFLQTIRAKERMIKLKR